VIISITVSEAVVRAAQDCNLSVEEFVDQLIDKGMRPDKTAASPMMSNAIERIRALRADGSISKR
jgi:hypothetical protein